MWLLAASTALGLFMVLCVVVFWGVAGGGVVYVWVRAHAHVHMLLQVILLSKKQQNINGK